MIPFPLHVLAVVVVAFLAISAAALLVKVVRQELSLVVAEFRFWLWKRRQPSVLDVRWREPERGGTYGD